LGTQSSDDGNGSYEYYPTVSESKTEGKELEITEYVLLGLGLVAAGYILNRHFSNTNANTMGEGRIYNQQIYNYAQGIQDLEDLPNFKRGKPAFGKMYRTHNIAYPDILYENPPYKQQKPDNTYVNYPIPPSDAERAQLNYAEPSNVITDSIIYEQGTPDLREDYRLTGVLGAPPTRWSSRTPGGIDSGAGNTIFTTEYAPGISEKVRRDNPVVVSETSLPNGRKVQKLNRLAPMEKKNKRRFNVDYDEEGNPLTRTDPVYDTFDYLSDLKFTNEDFGEGEPGGRVTDDTLKVWEDFLVKGQLREGYEIIPAED
jgi:hypothetical protein